MLKTWTFHDYAVGEGESLGAHRENLETSSDWLPISVPGDIHRTLVEAGRLKDPFYDQNEAHSVWLEEREWWYRTSFTAPEPKHGSLMRQRLVFHGLDTSALISRVDCPPNLEPK